MQTYTVRGTVTDVRRLQRSANGNPRFRIAIHSEMLHGFALYRTAPDAGAAYGIGESLIGRTVDLTVLSSGHEIVGVHSV